MSLSIRSPCHYLCKTFLPRQPNLLKLMKTCRTFAGSFHDYHESLSQRAGTFHDSMKACRTCAGEFHDPMEVSRTLAARFHDTFH